MSIVPPTESSESPRDPRLATLPVQPGDMLAGKYRVDRVLGVGGMGVVVAATNVMLDQVVALKFMLPQATANKDAVARFVREARAAVKLRSEHVGRVLDVGTLENNAPFIVMEYLDGTDLSSLLARRGVLSIPEAAGYVLQAIDAIAEAHSIGVIHRDLKPANLFVARRNDGSPLVKVLDFGISKAKLSVENLTSTSALMGSPGYMSPEQMKASRDVDPRTDIWSLGVILYELVSGRLPFVADTMPELCVKILQDPFPPLRQIAPTVPPDFEMVVARCMQKHRDHRYTNVAELAQALEAFASPRDRGIAERTAAVLGVTVEATTSALASSPGASSTHGFAAGTLGEAAPPRRSRSWLAALAAGVVVVGLVIAIAIVRGGGSDADPPATAQAKAPSVTPAPPTPAPPPPPPSPPPVAEPAVVDTTAITGTVQAAAGILTCKNHVEGPVELDVSVDGAGKGELTDVTPGAAIKPFRDCVARQIKKLAFPKAAFAGRARVTMTFPPIEAGRERKPVVAKPKADPPKPKLDPVKVVAPKVDPPKPDPPKADPPKPDPPKPDPPKPADDPFDRRH